MTFVTAGLAIAGVVAMAIPILIHLLWRQRRRPVRWGAMKFLIEAYRRHRRRLQLEQILLLALRCLLVGLIGFALARPVLEAGGVIDLGGARNIYIVIDDGLASSAVLDDGATALEHHVASARSIVEGLDPGDFVGLITTARPAEAKVVPPSSDHGGVIELLESLEHRETPSDLHGAIVAVSRALADAEDERARTLVYLLSDFRTGSAPLERPLPPVLANLPGEIGLVAIAPATTPVANVQITGLDPVRSVVLPNSIDGSGRITVRVARHGGQLEADVSRIRLEGTDLGAVEPKLVEWTRGMAEAEVDFSVDVPEVGDRQLALTAAIDDDRLAADNRRYATLEARQRLRLLLIDRRSFGFEPGLERLTPGQWMRRALEPTHEGAMDVVEVEPVAMEATDLRRTDVAILPRPDLVTEDGWAALREFVDRGGMLIVTPPAEATVHQWPDRMTAALALPWRLAVETTTHPGGMALADEQPSSGLLRMIGSELDVLARPVLVERMLPLDESSSRGQRILRLSDGSTLMLAGAPETTQRGEGRGAAAASSGPVSGRGLVVYFAAAPELSWTNLPSKPLMVPLWQELIRQGLSSIRASHRVAVGEVGSLGLSPAARSLVDPDGRRVPLDGAGAPQRPLDRSGLWTAVDAAGQPVANVPVNVETPSAELLVQSEAAVGSWLGASGPWTMRASDELGAAIGAVDSGSPLWRILLVTLLVVVLLETMLARWFSHALRASAGGSAILEETGRLSVGASR